MIKLSVEFENCYGIKKLKHCFDFSEKKVFSIYAPNGTMKTSFAKACKDHSAGKNSIDSIFKNRISARLINDETETALEAVQVFVIEPYDPAYKSERITTLLVNKRLKDEYEEVLKSIEQGKTNLYSKLKQLSGLSGRNNNIEEEISKAFGNKPIFDVLSELSPIVNDETASKFSHIIYNKIFEEKVVAFLNTKDFKKQIADYIEKYDSLIDASKYLKRGFNHSNVATIQKNLKENGFFKAKHSLNLFNGTLKDEIESEDRLLEIMSDEMEKVLNDKDIREKFREIDSKLTTAQLREFRDYLHENQEITTELSDLNKLKKEIWISYFKDQKELFNSLFNEYENGKVKIAEIIKAAREEATEWNQVIKTFNKRFSVPFILEMKNQEDVILKSSAPTLGFIFTDSDVNEQVAVQENDLMMALSQGEKRALYILNIIFEVRARKKANQKTLFIIDDVADSFDYKNKYAIIEYLKEISETDYFYQIILTHNFDFYRTVQGRLLEKAQWKNSLIAQRQKEEIKLIEGGNKRITNPFNVWKKEINNKVVFVATIPFVRNLVEFREGSKSENYSKLTSLLHIKDDTDDVLVGDIKDIYSDTLKGVNLDNYDANQKVIHIIFAVADEVSEIEIEETLNLENKIALSIGIRLKAEAFMWGKVTDKSPIKGSQTGKLFDRYKTEYKDDGLQLENIKLCELVNLMTPENIHLNSFMYEPILDMSNEHLRKLYKDLIEINSELVELNLKT